VNTHSNTSEPVICPYLVIGGGVSGLAITYHLSRLGKAVTLLEASSRVGGAVGSLSEAGWLRELGPNSLIQTPEMAALLSQLDLGEEIIEANPIAKKRFVSKNGHPVALPGNPLEFLTSPLFGMGDLWHLAREAWIKPTQQEESIAEFVRRRLGQGFLDWAVDPFVSGVYAGDPERLSVQAAIPKIYALERESGSLIRGGIAKMKAAKTNPAPVTQPAKGKLFSFKRGLQTLTDALATAITASDGGDIQLDTRSTSIRQLSNGGWSVETTQGKTYHTRQLILSTPAHISARLLGDVDSELAESLATIEYPPVASVVMGFERSQVAHPLDGFGLLLPSKEKKRTLGVLFSSTLFPNRTPEGKVLLTAFIGGRKTPDAAEGSDEELMNRVLADLAPLLGIKGKPEFLRVKQWAQAIPQYEIGYLGLQEKITQRLASLPGLNLNGNWRGGIAVGDCLISGQKMAEHLGPLS
jgi:protoporphyrinogen/coproporphyrinogen III oxidase